MTKPLTRGDILAMEAGPEMDALVAERVMGWTNPTGFEARWHCNGVELDMFHGVEGGGGDYYHPDEAWSPSTDIAAAWEVVEKMKCVGSGVQVWIVNRFSEVSATHPDNKVRANTAPLAICRAALLAMLEDA